MSDRTVRAFLVASLVAGGAVALLLTGAVPVPDVDADTGGGDGAADGDGRLRELWASTPPADLQSNHHSPAAARVGGEAFVAVPINSRHGTLCRLSVLDGDGAERWHRDVPEEECTVHAVSDPTVVDYDRDGSPEVLAATSAREVVAANLSTGAVEMRHGLASLGYARPLVVDFAPPPGPETVVVDILGGVSVLRPDGETVWTRRLGDARVRGPAVRDFDADGEPELAVGQLDGGVVVLAGDGRVAWRRNVSRSVSVRWMAAGRLDGDDPVELVLGTFTGHVVALDGANGSVEWDRDMAALGSGTLGRGPFPSGAATLHGVRGAAVHAVGDGDGDGTTEVYPVARNGLLAALDGSNGSVEWTARLTDSRVTVAPPPVLGDVDGDGDPELVAATYAGRVAVVDPATGEVLADYERGAHVNTFPELADVDGDGADEILVIYGNGRIVALSYGSGG